ncbi:PilZ domain-containing protein [Proteobacteria bacterium 005FR1]|nr:PilZ domain-containing protein [Proteobacteria bacterium 005FR1]
MANVEQAEQRKLLRHVLSGPVNIYDRVSKSFLGRLVNVHTEGLMIMGNHPFTADSIYQLDMQLPQAIEGCEMISIGVDCLWSRSEDTHVHWAGCKIIDASEDARRQIQALIELFGEQAE